MMGRLYGFEERENGQVDQGNTRFSTEQNRTSSLQFGRNTSTNIPIHQNFVDASLPQISTAHLTSQLYRSPSAAAATRTPTSLPSFHRPASVQESKSSRSCATSPTFKLPPISTPKSTSLQTEVNMPPHSISENSVMEPQQRKEDFPPNLDMKMAYENMMIGYFMPQPNRTHEQHLQMNPSNIEQYNFNADQKNYAMQTSQQNFQYAPHFQENYSLPCNTLPQEMFQSLQHNQILHNPTSSQSQKQSAHEQHNIIKSNIPGSTMMNTSHFREQENLAISSNLINPSSLHHGGLLKQEEHFNPSTNIPHASSKSFQSSSNVPVQNQSDISAMASVLNELSMFISPQETAGIESGFSTSNIRAIPSSNMATLSSSSLSTIRPHAGSAPSVPCQTKMEPNWGSFSVLPPVAPSATPSGGTFNDGDNASLMSYSSAFSNAQIPSQMGQYYNTISPFSVNFPEAIPSAFTTSPRYSARSSYSSRSRNKRSLSISPLSAEGLDINAIIRMSPTSLNAYLNGSRSSSSCVSPGSYGEKAGCYGHLSARNSSSSPHSGSGSSGNRRSASFTPQTGTPNNSNTSDSSNLPLTCSNNEKIKNDFFNMDDSLFIMQAMQDLETAASFPNLPSSFNTNVIPNAQVPSEYENLQVLPQDLAAFRTEDYIPFVPSVLPPVHTHLPSQFQPSTLATIVPPHSKPPPTYDQHMAARKATLQKNNSSDSSQPSNSNSSSFESSEGDKTVAGSSGTDTESNRMFACRWLDCAAVFQDQDEFVTHIEKIHIDQKKGEDFVCFWKLCPRRLHPFNARYKLLVHMRIHSGDKPNKCTYTGCSKAFSRLENLKIHLRSHTGERPYACTFQGCTKTFSNSSDRTKHQKTHHDTKPYVCQVTGCGKRYTDPSSLRKHVKKSHPDKKEPDRKKIRSAVEELDPKDLSECLVIHSIKPVTLYDASPPEPTDSGLGRSPRSSQPGSSSDHYPGLIYSNEVQGTSSQTSPSSQHSSPPGHNDRERIPPNNNSLRVPILPPIAPSPVQQLHCLPSLKSPVATNTPTFGRVTSSASSVSRNSSSLLQRPKLTYEAGMSNNYGNIYNESSTSPNSRSSFTSPLRHH